MSRRASVLRRAPQRVVRRDRNFAGRDGERRVGSRPHMGRERRHIVKPFWVGFQLALGVIAACLAIPLGLVLFAWVADHLEVVRPMLNALGWLVLFCVVVGFLFCVVARIIAIMRKLKHA